MTISTETSVVTYIGNGATTSFVFSFVGVSAADISVQLTDSVGTITTLNPALYTLVLTAPSPGELWGIGGTVHYPLVGSPIDSSVQLSIVRNVPLTQDVSIANQGAFYPQAVEQGLDLLEMQLQQVNTEVLYSYKAPFTDASAPNTLPPAAERANKFFSFDSSGQPLMSTGTNGVGGGTVTAVALTAPAEFIVTGSPINTSGTLTLTKALETAGTVWAGPATGPSAMPTFRGLVPSDVPTATSSTSGIVKPDNTSITISGGVISSVSSGGTVTTTGSPTSGALTRFSGATSITNTDLTGDVTTSGGSATTLAASGVTAATYGDATHIPQVTFDAKGRATSASNVAVTVPIAANPTATASDVAVNGTAGTFMRSDASPAVQLTSAAQFGLAKVDGTTITAAGGVISGASAVTAANPTATASDTAVNGTSVHFMRADAAPAIQKTSASLFGLAKVDGTSITASSGVISAASGTGPEIAPFLVVPASPGFDPVMIYNSSIVLSNSNKTATPASSSPYNYCYGTTARYTGKKYWEVVPGSTTACAIGATGARGHVVDVDANSPGNFGQRYIGNVGWSSDGKISTNNVETGSTTGVAIATYATWAASNVLGFALDIDNLLMWFRVGAGNWNNNASANPATGTLGLAVPMLLSGASSYLIWIGMNLGNTSATTMRQITADFTQSVPSGFSSWSGL